MGELISLGLTILINFLKIIAKLFQKGTILKSLLS
jgi:hypothetical protein